jgi:hypothetical protein
MESQGVLNPEHGCGVGQNATSVEDALTVNSAHAAICIEAVGESHKE